MLWGEMYVHKNTHQPHTTNITNYTSKEIIT